MADGFNTDKVSETKEFFDYLVAKAASLSLSNYNYKHRLSDNELKLLYKDEIHSNDPPYNYVNLLSRTLIVYLYEGNTDDSSIQFSSLDEHYLLPEYLRRKEPILVIDFISTIDSTVYNQGEIITESTNQTEYKIRIFWYSDSLIQMSVCENFQVPLTLDILCIHKPVFDLFQEYLEQKYPIWKMIKNEPILLPSFKLSDVNKCANLYELICLKVDKRSAHISSRVLEEYPLSLGYYASLSTQFIQKNQFPDMFEKNYLPRIWEEYVWSFNTILEENEKVAFLIYKIILELMKDEDLDASVRKVTYESILYHVNSNLLIDLFAWRSGDQAYKDNAGSCDNEENRT